MRNERAAAHACVQLAGTVVGAMQTSDAVRSETAFAIGGVKAMPAVRALAKKLGVDLARVTDVLLEDGVVIFADAFTKLLAAIDAQRKAA